jgi:hypothetical protein
MSGLRVVAPYVTMKIKQQTGGVVISGFYKHAVVQAEDVDPADRKRLTEKGMLEDVVEPEPEPAPEPVKEPEKTPEPPAAKAKAKGSDSTGGGN